jgi:hypothetical protein
MSKDYSVLHFKKTSSVSDRIEKTKLIISNLQPTSILDIGGNDYKDFCFLNNISYTCIDLERPQKTGQGGYNKDKDGLTYNGRDLPFNTNQFDLVIVNFVLHHASNNALFLLEQIRNISSKYVLIGEDLAELNYDLKWHYRNYIHQPGGIFRSDEEWQILFKLYNLNLKQQYIIHRTDDIDNKHIYRCLYILEKK